MGNKYDKYLVGGEAAKKLLEETKKAMPVPATDEEVDEIFNEEEEPSHAAG